MTQICTPKDIKSLGTILGIWAHPDDETFSMGGIMAAAVSNGQIVACVTATKGELGVQDESRWPAKHLAEIRSNELKAAFTVLGVSNHHWLGYHDGSCDTVDEDEAVDRILLQINHYQPDTVMTFGADGMTGHSDHMAVSRWAGLAVERTGRKIALYHATQTDKQYQNMLEADKHLNIFFNIEKPETCEEKECEVCFKLTGDIYDKKLAALKAMPSQTEAMINNFGHLLKDSIGVEAFRLVR